MVNEKTRVTRRKTININGLPVHEIRYEYYCTSPKIYPVS